MPSCPNCGATDVEVRKFCRHCGARIIVTGEEATTWRLPREETPAEGKSPLTSPVSPTQTGENKPNTSPAYMPPVMDYPPAIIAPPPPEAGRVHVALGEWLTEGWRVYQENWLAMSGATIVATLLSGATMGILAGPMLMALFRMAFKTMRGEKIEVGDVFKWEGRFIHAFIAFLLAAVIHLGVTGIADGAISTLLGFAVDPFLVVMLGFVLPLVLERKTDVAPAINTVGKMIFSRDAMIWWVVGLVFSVISSVGLLGCCVAVFVSFPFVVSSAAVAYRDIFGLDDPNRTMP